MEALRQLLVEVQDLDLSHVDLTTDPDNVAFQKVIAANGGVLTERFTKPVAYGVDQQALRWRIELKKLYDLRLPCLASRGMRRAGSGRVLERLL